MKSKWTKEKALIHWKSLDEGQDILPHMEAIPYKSKGSTYGACGIRIDGNPEFIDAVLSRLKDLTQGEGISTRLGLSRNQVDGKGLDKSFDNKADHAEVVYIRLHERGGEGQMYQAYIAGAKKRSKARRELAELWN